MTFLSEYATGAPLSLLRRGAGGEVKSQQHLKLPHTSHHPLTPTPLPLKGAREELQA